MWKEADLVWLKANQPGLKETSPGIIIGRVSFQMIHDVASNGHIINPEAQYLDQLKDPAFYISDTYQVEIRWHEGEIAPRVKETSDRIKTTAAKLGREITDLHLYQEEVLCLASSQELNISFAKSFSLEIFINEYLIPFLFAQTYYAQHQHWPWGELAHGQWGLLEWLGKKSTVTPQDVKLTVNAIAGLIGDEKTTSLFAERCRPHKPCPCGSGKKAKDCHPHLQPAIARIRRAFYGGWMSET